MLSETHGLVFSLKTGCHTKVKEPNLPYYLLIGWGSTDGIMPFPRALAQSEMQTGFELTSPIPFPTMITITLSVP